MNQKSGPETLQALSAKRSNGQEFNFSELKGKTILVVNTASHCGFTPQYKGLEELNKKYSPQGLAIVGFPCDQFAHQEPASDGEIQEFCSVNFGVSFPLMAKTEVNGPQANPVFKFLKSRAGGWFNREIKWNFTKFLILPDGRTVRRFSPTTTPEQLVPAIEKALQK